ncbi:MAG: TIGR02253 family HAD-type hydrolase [Candidatus Hydrothermarchaeota archaeon]|nr:TIGR02253 family HAD-type hydrolase [Candidatus Hydrothermarchaeota archaeon]
MIKAVLFDLDNTLINFSKMKRMCVESAVDAMIDAGLEMGREDATEKLYEIYDEKGIEYQQIFDDFLREVLGDIDYKILGSAIAVYRKTKLAYLEPYPHVIPTLTKLSKMGVKLAIVSDAPRLQAWTRLCSLKLHHLFDAVVTFEDTGETKATDKPFREVLNRLKMKPMEALMVGDWPERDIAGAKKMGIKTALLIQEEGEPVDSSKADYVIRDVSEIVDFVNGQYY